MTPVTMYRPAVGNGGYEAVRVAAEVRQAGRGDVDADGISLPGGSVLLTVDSRLGPRRGWYAVISGQQFVVVGESPVPPLFNRTQLTCARNSDQIDVVSHITVGGQSPLIGAVSPAFGSDAGQRVGR